MTRESSPPVERRPECSDFEVRGGDEGESKGSPVLMDEEGARSVDALTRRRFKSKKRERTYLQRVS